MKKEYLIGYLFAGVFGFGVFLAMRLGNPWFLLAGAPCIWCAFRKPSPYWRSALIFTLALFIPLLSFPSPKLRYLSHAEDVSSAKLVAELAGEGDEYKFCRSYFLPEEGGITAVDWTQGGGYALRRSVSLNEGEEARFACGSSFITITKKEGVFEVRKGRLGG